MHDNLGNLVRVIVILLGFIAMYGLWTAHAKRRSSWTEKMYEIWVAQFLFTFAAIMANIELLHRGIFPTIGAFMMIPIFLLVIKTTLFTNMPYLKDQELKRGKQKTG